jgi:hypothetical protein
MAELKTKPTKQSVASFLKTIADEGKQRDCRTVLKIMKKVTKAEPKMWGPGIVGFGSHHYKYASGREADWFLTGFAPRKQNLTLYLMSGFKGYDALLGKLGKYKTGKACLYIKKLDEVDLGVLTDLIQKSVKHVAKSNSRASTGR